MDFTLIAKHSVVLLSANLVPLALISSISLWGFGLWALAVNLLLILRYLRQEMPFFPRMVSYVFPTAAFALRRLLCHNHIELFKPLAPALYGFLMVIWISGLPQDD